MKKSNDLLKKLQSRFFILFLAIFGVMILGAFAVIYLVTYHNVQLEISRRLEAPFANGNNWQQDPSLVQVHLSQTGEITDVESVFEVPEGILKELVEVATIDGRYMREHEAGVYQVMYRDIVLGEHVVSLMDAPIISERITVGGRHWRFLSSQNSYRFEANLEGMFTVMEAEQDFIFLDVTDYYATLSSLVQILLIIALALLPIIVVISFFFAKRATKPMAIAWAEQKRFIADASHELKTPITIMKSNLGLVMTNPHETVGQQMEWLEYVHAGTEKMSKLVLDLLALANADSQDLQVHREEFDASDMVKGLISALEVQGQEKSLEFVSDITPDLIVRNDEDKIAQIIMILLDNAVKYSEAGGSVQMSLKKVQQKIQFAVSNGGKGIRETELRNIFERFYQTEPSRNSESGGVGLGLSIAKALTEKINGKLTVESGENEKTTFTLTI